MSKKKEPETTPEGRAPSVRLEATSVGLNANHLCIVVTDEVGAQTAFRGGPSQRGPDSPPVSGPSAASSSPSSQGSYGPIRTTEGRYDERFIDYDPRAPKTAVETGGQSTSDLLECFRRTASEIDRRQIPYFPTGPNSNSTVFTLLERCGCRGDPPAWSPGYQRDLLGKKDDKEDK